MLVLTAEDVRQALPMDQTIEAMKSAYAALSAGRAEVPLRARLPIASHEAVSLFMPAYLQDDQGEALAVKIVSVFPHNQDRGMPIIYGAVIVLEADTGRLLAVLEGGALTAIRTGAGAGAATDLLARPDSRVAAIFGAGVQARTQLEAVCTARAIHTAWIYDPNPLSCQTFIEQLAGRGPIPTDLRPASTPEEALSQADIVCTATTSPTPVFSNTHLKPGSHINAIGSYTPEMQEIPGETLARALVTVDSRSAVLSESGDLIIPIREGVLTKEHIHAEIGEIVLGTKSGRSDEQQITFFKSVGIAVQDAMAGRLALKNAREKGLGQQITW